MKGFSHSQLLWSKIRLAQPRLDEASYALWKHANLAALFPDFLFMLYSSMRSTVPIMETAKICALRMAEGDPVAAGAAEYFSQHIKEELHHDEWLLEDMVAIGMERSSIASRTPPASIASLVGTQYYWIHYAHPVALFGYLAVLEGNSPLAEQLNEIQIRNDLPPVAFRTLRQHAEMDPEHLEELNQKLDQLPLSEQQSALIAVSAFQTIELLSSAFEQLLAWSRKSLSIALADVS